VIPVISAFFHKHSLWYYFYQQGYIPVSVQHISSVGIITEKNVLSPARGGKTGTTLPSPACFQHEGINFPAALKQKSGARLFPAQVIYPGKLMKWTATLLNL
jgi:hypothetical protein